MREVSIPAFPSPLRPLNQPERWEVVGTDTLVMEAGPGTDLFTDPDGGARHASAPALLGRIEGDFTLSARVGGDLTATYDAAVLLLYSEENTWAKFCLEVSPQGRPTIVSVVNRAVSDDCNSFPVGEDVELRVSRLGPAFAFHVRAGDDFWHLVRYFALPGSPEVGFLTQSPLGEGHTARFTAIHYSGRRLTDLRDGT